MNLNQTQQALQRASDESAQLENLMRSILKLFADGRLIYRKREVAQASVAEKAARLRCLRLNQFECSPLTPCCERRDEYNGYGSDGPLLFRCWRKNGCACHD